VAAKLGLGKLLREHAGPGGEGGDLAQLQSNENVLADLTEALIGAVYVTFGYEAVRPAVIEAFDEHIEFAEHSYIDHKTELQEYLARSARSVNYKVLGFSGPPHEREFEIEACVDGEALGHGFGSSKKRAEQEAAAEALHELQTRARRTTRRARLRGRRARRDEEGGAPDAPELAASGVSDPAAQAPGEMAAGPVAGADGASAGPPRDGGG
jgi:dsRNA-specific ribonuclease